MRELSIKSSIYYVFIARMNYQVCGVEFESKVDKMETKFWIQIGI